MSGHAVVIVCDFNRCLDAAGATLVMSAIELWCLVVATLGVHFEWRANGSVVPVVQDDGLIWYDPLLPPHRQHLEGYQALRVMAASVEAVGDDHCMMCDLEL